MFFLSKSETTFLKILYSLTKWAVPVFFMITGVLFLRRDKKISIKDCIFKYARRIFLALMIFGIPFAILIILFETRRISFWMVPESIVRTINGESFGHLWFLYTLIGIYLTLPLFKTFVNNASKSLIRYIMAVMFVFNFLFPFINDFAGINIAFKIPVAAYPVLYMLLGFYIENEKPLFLKHKWLGWLGITFSSIVVIVAGVFNGPIDDIMTYSSPIVLIFSISVFILFCENRKECTMILWKIDRLCFCVYLIHPLFIQFMYKYMNIIPTGNSLYPILSILFAIFFIFISFMTSWMLSCIRPLKRYVI